MDEAPLAFVQRWINELRSLPADGGDTPQRLKQLEAELTDRASKLPAYELQRCQRELESAQKQVTHASAATVGTKPRFAFKKRAAAATEATAAGPAPIALSPSPPTATTSSAPPISSAAGTTSEPFLPPNALSLSDRSDAYLSQTDLPSLPGLGASPSPAASTSQALAISSVSACVIDLLPSSDSDEPNSWYSAVYLSGLTESLILLPENGRKGSVLVQNCQRCVIVLGGHQIRIHDSTDCVFSVAAGSSPIVERCRRLKFAAYPTSLLESQQDPPAQPTRLDVQDFDDPFASASRPSPNWRLATDEEVGSLDRAVALLSRSSEGQQSTDNWKAALKTALQSD